MEYQIPPDIEQLVAERMRLGIYSSRDEVLREALRALAERDEDIAAIRAGIEDMETGRTLPLREADAEIRSTLGFRPAK